MNKGDTFGLVSLVRDRADEISVIADMDSSVIVINGATTHQLLPKYPSIAVNIEKLIEVRLNELKYLDEMP